MMTIYSKGDLRVAYNILNFVKDKVDNKSIKYIRLLQEIRRFQKAEDPIKTTYISWGSDAYIAKLTFPVGWSKSDARSFFAQHEYIPKPTPSQYDCTGRKWTHDFKITTLHGQTVIYHWVLADL